jgi:parallel beta-helix repeat protein
MSDRASKCVLLLALCMVLLTLTHVADLEGIATQSTTVVSEPEKQEMFPAGTPHDPIWIDGDSNFSDTALVEGWPGDGTPENPFIIDGLEIDLGARVGICIAISNTQVSFIISNCILTGAITDPWTGRGAGAGILLENVTNGELVNNTCNNNIDGIYLYSSYSNTVGNNTCNSNLEVGIELFGSAYNIISDNTCNSYKNGIFLYSSVSNTVTNNTCNNNYLHGIYLYHSHQNTVSDNTCNNNRIGIYLLHSSSNIVINNTCTGNTEHELYLYDSNTITEEFGPVVLLFIGLVGITLLGSWKGGVKLLGWWRVNTTRGQDDIIIPARYRIASWVRNRRTLKHVDVDETLEPDSSD